MSRALAPLLVIVLACTACSGPRDASPMPEPPSLDLSKVGPPAVVAEYNPTDVSVPFIGEPGSAPPGSVVRITDLDGPNPPTAASVEADGSFRAFVLGDYGHEFRFQLVVDGERGTPVDAFYLLPAAGAYLAPSPRHDCLTLEPGFEVTFEAVGVSTLSFANDCDGELTVANGRSRTASPGSRSSTALPLVIAAGSSARLSLEYQGSAFESSEDTLFVDVTLDGRAIRYPITLFAP